MKTIRLAHPWVIRKQIGQGGFAKVYLASSATGEEAVVKLIPKTPGADRELLFVELSDIPNVLPILDKGETEGSYALVMPRADKSLRQHLVERGGKLPIDEVITVLTNVATTLESIYGKVVHRDIKPENVLLYKGRWHLADFGIARYAEASTDPNTWKFSFTPAYAAPEQWRHERATSATDVYAFGVMAYELLNGNRPFPGPDFRNQHLNQPPPRLTDVPPILQALIADCLSKTPESRPTPRNILDRLKRAQSHVNGSETQLRRVSALLAQKAVEESARVSAERSEAERRKALYNDAQEKLHRIAAGLKTKILDNAPNVQHSQPHSLYLFTLSLGASTLTFTTPKPASVHKFGDPSFNLKFDVVATATIRVTQAQGDYGYKGREHALWYCDAQNEGEYRWFEVAFMISPLTRLIADLEPFALTPDKEDAILALSPVVHKVQVAWPFTPTDQGNEEEFYERWIGWFAQAAQNSLRRPATMPERDVNGSWRR